MLKSNNLKQTIMTKNELPPTMYAPSINGVEWILFRLNEETELYHWNGDKNYAGYTMRELEQRIEDYYYYR